MAEIETRMLIGGERVAGDGEELAVENPWWYPYGDADSGPHDGAGA